MDGVDWIDMALDRDQWRALVNTVMNLWGNGFIDPRFLDLEISWRRSRVNFRVLLLVALIRINKFCKLMFFTFTVNVSLFIIAF
jgi:hypothetical protein